MKRLTVVLIAILIAILINPSDVGNRLAEGDYGGIVGRVFPFVIVALVGHVIWTRIAAKKAAQQMERGRKPHA